MSPASLDNGVQVVTTTIYSPSPSATSSSSQSSTSSAANLPLASIIGGSVAGVLLAITAVIGWRLWGRSIKRKNEILRREALSKYTTKENTRRNASMSAVNISTPQHTFAAAPQERKVKFAFLPTPGTGKDISRRSSNDSFMTPSLPWQPWSAAASDLERRAFLNSSPQNPLSSPGPSSIQPPSSPKSSFLQPPVSLAHRISDTSTLSAYSTQSGEAHQTRAPGYFLARKFDPKRISNFTRSTRAAPQYSALTDVSEHPHMTQEYDEKI